jgi:hypothetical protein
MNAAHYKHWIDEEITSFASINTFSELSGFALRIMRRMPPSIHVISGPISTGGFGNSKDNMVVFGAVTEELILRRELNVLSWVPFENVIYRLLIAWRSINPLGQYCWDIMFKFYKPLFESGLITDIHFIAGWELSTGSKWEHEQCARIGIRIHYLPVLLSQQMFQQRPIV